MTLWQLGEPDSPSAAILLLPELAREIILGAMSRVRLCHPEQVNLLGMLVGALQKYSYVGNSPAHMVSELLPSAGMWEGRYLRSYARLLQPTEALGRWAGSH